MVGDVLLASIIANNLRTTFPNAYIAFLCYDSASAVLENNPSIDKIIKVKQEEVRKPINLLKMLLFIKKQHFSLVVDHYSKLESQLFSLFSNAKIRIGYDKTTIPFAYTTKIKLLERRVSPYGKAVDDRISFIKTIVKEASIDPYPKIYLSKEEIDTAKKTLSSLNTERKTIMLAVPGSSMEKSLPLNYMAHILNYLSENYEMNFLLNYSPSQEKYISQLRKELNASKNINFDIVAKNLRDFIKIMSQCDAIIGNEGGAIHIAKALKKPSFSIFSPFVPKEFWGTFENEKQNRSIHVKDLYPEIYKDKSRREIFSERKSLYQKLEPKYIIPEIDNFIQENVL